jgi:replicative DNA helicase
MATPTGVNLLSALRRSGSTAAIRDTPESYFEEADELAAFRYLRDHVTQYRAFPDANMFRRQTGITTLQVAQPLSFYLDQGRKRALYSALMDPFNEFRNAIERKDPDAFVAMAREVIQRSASFVSASSEFATLQAGLESVLQDYDDAHRTSGLRGIPTGWNYLNDITGGWFADDLISVIGRIGVGKTYMMLIMAYAAWNAGYNVLFVSMELGVTQLIRRLFGIHTKINPDLIRKGRLSSFMANQLQDHATGMVQNGIPFNVIAGGFKKSVETVQSVADATDPDIIFVDAGYLLKSSTKRKNSDGRRETISDTIEDLKRITIERRRPLVQSTQFNRSAERVRTRDSQQNTNPTSHLSLAKIAETDVIGQASSCVLGVAKAFPPLSEIRRWAAIMKGREGEGGRFQFKYEFSPVCFDFVSAASNNEEEETVQQDMSHMI